MAIHIPVSFFGMALLAAITLKPWAPGLAWGLYVLGVAVQLPLGLWLVGRLWQGGRAPDSINATTYLPGVAPNLVAATASASLAAARHPDGASAGGWPELSIAHLGST